MDDAVQLALANSPALQALDRPELGRHGGGEQAGRIANPVFTFERMRLGDELELGRLLSIGLLDLLTLPQRRAISRNQVAQAKTQLSINVVEQVSQVRRRGCGPWLHSRAWGTPSRSSRRRRPVRNWRGECSRWAISRKLQRARQHVFYADAAAQLASARNAATAAREELIRLLGLDDAQIAAAQASRAPSGSAQRPARPPDVTAAAIQQRLDVQLARLQLDVAGKAQGLSLLNSLVDVELGVRHDTVFDNATGERANRNGYELGSSPAGLRLGRGPAGGHERAVAGRGQSLRQRGPLGVVAPAPELFSLPHGLRPGQALPR